MIFRFLAWLIIMIGCSGTPRLEFRNVTEECRWMDPPDPSRWYHHAVGYQVFVGSFQDSTGDGWGDLQGIIQRLDYLNDGQDFSGDDLEITLLWLTPTFPSPSYHGYDVTDYEQVHPRLGTLDDLRNLVREGHRRNIRVLLDLVMNHTSREHPWFIASQDLESPFRNWYVWKPSNPGWAQPWNTAQSAWHPGEGGEFYYGLFWEGMPDLNWLHPPVFQEMLRIARFWLQDSGVAGFRLDAVRYLVESEAATGQQDQPETLAVWRRFSRALARSHPEALLLGEAWASNHVASQYHVGGDGLHLTFDFEFMAAVTNGILAEDASDIEALYSRFCQQFPPGAGQATFLSNHDVRRLPERLMNHPGSLRLAAQLLMTLPGTPFLYYGQELGLPNGPGHDDEQKRLPMLWNNDPHGGFTGGIPWIQPHGDPSVLSVERQLSDPDSLLNLYRSLIRLRRQHPALLRGGFRPARVLSPDSGSVWAFQRVLSDHGMLVVVNFSREPVEDVRVSPFGTEITAATWPPLPGSWVWPEGGGVNIDRGAAMLEYLPAQSIGVISLGRIHP